MLPNYFKTQPYAQSAQMPAQPQPMAPQPMMPQPGTMSPQQQQMGGFMPPYMQSFQAGVTQAMSQQPQMATRAQPGRGIPPNNNIAQPGRSPAIIPDTQGKVGDGTGY